MEPFRVERTERDREGAVYRINGHPAFQGRGVNTPHPSIRVKDQALIDLLLAYPIREVQNHFSSIELPLHSPEGTWPSQVIVRLWKLANLFTSSNRASLRDPVHFSFSARLDLAEWGRPWTPGAYLRTLDAVARAGTLPGLKWRTNFSIPTASFSCDVRSRNSILGEELAYWVRVLRSIDDEATAQLIAAQHTESLTTTFHFPQPIATACEQYLLYFVQFLADLGIQAEAEVQHRAAEVLFRVTPVEGREALERVREALDAYLSLPTDPSFAVVAAREHDLAVRQLEANVFHLQGQLSIARAVLQAKDAQIEALELSNFRLRQISGGEVQTSGQGGAPTPAAEDTEAIIPGVVSVKQVEKGGVVLHTPELLRKLKRQFGW